MRQQKLWTFGTTRSASLGSSGVRIDELDAPQVPARVAEREPLELSIAGGQLEAHAKSSKQLQGDLASLDRRLALDALRERADGRRHRVEVRVELCLAAMGPLAEFSVLGAEPGRQAAEAGEMLRTARAATFFVTQATQSQRWQN